MICLKIIGNLFHTNQKFLEKITKDTIIEILHGLKEILKKLFVGLENTKELNLKIYH